MRPSLLATAALLFVTALAAPGAARPIWKGRPPYGRELMTTSERKLYWREFLALKTDAERGAYYAANVEKMKQRVLERGVSEPEMPRNLSDAESPVVFWRAPYFEDVMTSEEKENYVPALDAIPDRLDRWRFVIQHIRTMHARGVERGVTVPSTIGFSDVFEALGEIPPDAETAVPRDVEQSAVQEAAPDAPPTADPPTP